jgi:hypothetical protein
MSKHYALFVHRMINTIPSTRLLPITSLFYHLPHQPPPRSTSLHHCPPQPSHQRPTYTQDDMARMITTCRPCHHVRKTNTRHNMTQWPKKTTTGGSKTWRMWQDRHRGHRVHRVARTRYAHYLFYFLFNVNNAFSLPLPTILESEHDGSFLGGLPLPGNYYQPQPSEMSHCAHFRGFDLSLATTTTHHPQKWAWELIFGSTVRPRGWENLTIDFNRNKCEFQQFSMDFPTICVGVDTFKTTNMCWNF